MNRSHIAGYPLAIVALAVQCVLPTYSAWASPYSAIGERNVFGLQDPPPPPSLEEQKEPEPPPNIKVTGVTMVNGIPRALLKVQVPAKPPTPAREDGYILVAGGPGQDGIEVLAIDEAYGKEKEVRVQVRHAGKASWLALEKDTARAAAAPPPGANPAQVLAAQKLAAARAAAVAASGGTPQSPNPAGVLTRPMRGSAGQAGMAGQAGLAGVGQRGSPSSRIFQARDQVGNLTPEEQIILIEANRLNTLEDQAGGLVPPPPATVATPAELDPTVQPPPEDSIEELLRGLQK